jgi:hypothetical protein
MEHIKLTAANGSRKYYVIAIFMIVFFSFLAPAANTEGWFTELTRGRGLLEILTADDILLPPLYPLIIRFIGFFGDHLVVFRITGIVLALFLFRLTYLCLNTTIRALGANPTAAINLAGMTSLYLVVFCFGLSNYLLLYDFTILVMAIQILCLFYTLKVFLLTVRREDVTKLAPISSSPEVYAAKSAFWGLVGIALKHSNMGVHFIFLAITYVLLLFHSRATRSAAFAFAAATIVIILSTGSVLFFIAAWHPTIEFGNFLNFILPSLEAKGGAGSITDFSSSTLQQWYLLFTRNYVLLLTTSIAYCAWIRRGSVFSFFNRYLANENLFIVGIMLKTAIITCNAILIIFTCRSLLVEYVPLILEIFIISTTILFVSGVTLRIVRSGAPFLRRQPSGQLGEIFTDNSLLILIWLLASIGCILGNAISSSIGYNGMYIGLAMAIGINLTICVL